MPNTVSPLASVTAVKDAPTKIAEILKAYGGEVASLANQPRLPTSPSTADQLAELKQQTIADLRRLENLTGLALAEARDQLEAAILPAMSTDPHVQRVFELRQARALARLLPLLRRAATEAAVDETVRQFADEAARQGDWAALRVLRVETAPYLAGRGIDLTTSEALGIIERTVAALRPRAAGALAERRALDHGAARVAEAFVEARYAVERDEQGVQLPCYEADAVENVTLRAT